MNISQFSMTERAIHHEWKELPDSIPLLGVVGQVASGKDTLSQVLEERFGFKHYVGSQIVRDYGKEVGMPTTTRDEIIQVKDVMYERYGPGIIIDRFLKNVTQDYNDAIQSGRSYNGALINGFRVIETALYFKTIPNVLLIGVDSKKETRFGRYINRQKSSDDLSRQKFDEVEELEGEGIEQVMKIADVVFYNGGTKEEFENELKTYFSRLFPII